ncbi:MAG: ABC transporter permease, partial [Bacteroidota bacterium]
MLKNYLLTALRTFRKERFYMIINVGGLMLSFFSCLVLCLYIRDEFSYDDFHEHKDHIYRIFEENSGRQFAVTPYPWAESLVEEFSEIEDIARVLPISAIFQVDDQLFSEPRGIVADTSFFNVFSFPLVSGDAATALTSPNTVLITPALAEKYFGTIEVLDQMIEINLFGDAESFAVAGVIEPPAQSQLQFDFVLPYERVIANNPNPHAFENWSVHFLYSYVLANQPLDPADMKVRLKEFLDRHHGDWLSAKYNPQVEPLSSIYLHSNKEFELPVRGSFTDLLILAAVALSILVIGLINYINLTTARAFSRLRGASVRRVYGATKWHITQQHLVESSLLVGLSMLLAALSVQVLHQPLSEISGKDFS